MTEPSNQLQNWRSRISQKLDVAGYRRLFGLIRTYAGEYKGSYTVLLFLNVTVFLLSTIVTFATAAVITTLTGQVDEVATHASGIAALNLNKIGSQFIEFLRLEEGDSLFRNAALLAAIGFGVGFLRSIVRFASMVLGAYTSQRASRNIQIGLFKKYMGFSIGFFNQNKAGKLISRMEADTQATITGVQALLFSFTVNPLLVAFYAILTIQASPTLFAVVIFVGVLHMALAGLLSKPVQENTRKNLIASANYRAVAMEGFTGIRVVKSFCAEDYEISKIIAGLTDMLKVAVSKAVLTNYQNEGRLLINALGQTIILIFCAYEMSQGRLRIDSTLLFVYLTQSVVSPISQIGNAFVTMQGMKAASERIDGYFKQQSDVPDGTKECSGFNEQILLKNVSFRYIDKTPAVSNVTLTIKKGEMVALVGHSGAGKSTMADLILRFYDPQEGSIFIDGVDLRELKQSSYRRLFGIVSQESLLFNDTIRNNITYGRENLGESDVIHAAQVANAHEFILQTPEGYDTFVGDRGIRLSGGQRQRIAIARAVVGHPQILVLDEATSALDSESERAVQEAINNITRQTTSIVIAHRLSTVMHADKIVVMEAGRVVACGTHTELSETCAIYKRLCEIQFTSSRQRHE